MTCSTAIRSSMELMLESIQRREEHPRDLPPALPVRPVSKARLPPGRRVLLPIKVVLNQFVEENNVAADVKLGEIESNDRQISVGKDDFDLVLNKTDTQEDTRKRTLQGVLEIQKSFRGHQVRCNYHELKRGICTLQSFVRGEIVRRDYKIMMERMQAATVLQMHIKKDFACRTLQKRLRAVIYLQAATRGWLTRRHLQRKVNLKNGPGNMITGSTRTPNCESPVKEDHVQVQSSVLDELQRRVLRAEAALERKEEENAALQQQLQQFENRWSQYEGKMKSMEKMWQDQLLSLQISIATAKKSIAAEDVTSKSGKVAASPDYFHFIDSSDRSSPVKHAPSHNVGREQINDDNGFILKVKSEQLTSSSSSTTTDTELRKLKRRFSAWKKDFKVHLRETVTTFQKLGQAEKEKSHKKRWWSKGGAQAGGSASSS